MLLRGRGHRHAEGELSQQSLISCGDSMRRRRRRNWDDRRKGSRKMRWLWIALLLTGCALCSAPAADASAIYKLGGSGIKALADYHVLELTFEGTRVYGQAR